MPWGKGRLWGRTKSITDVTSTLTVSRLPPTSEDLTVLEMNWRIFFRLLDINNDKHIDWFELESLQTVITATCSPNKEVIRNMEIAIGGWWKIHFNHFGNSRLIATEDDYVAAMTSMYTKHRPAFIGYTKDLGNFMFDVMDRPGGGTISRRDYERFMRIFGANNSFHTGRIFERLDLNGNGVVSRDEFQYAMLQYQTIPDPAFTFMFKIPGVTI